MTRNRHHKRGDGFAPESRTKSAENQHIRKPKFMILSDEYKSLSACSKAIMDCMQIQHYTGDYTGYGVEQAQIETGFSNRSVTRGIAELLGKRFLILKSNYNHSKGKVRKWEMTWMSYHGKKPRDLWKG